MGAPPAADTATGASGSGRQMRKALRANEDAGHRNRNVLGKEITSYFRRRLSCLRYLFSQPVTRQLSSAQMSLTSVFGMGTGGPSSQSTPTISGYTLKTEHQFIIFALLLKDFTESALWSSFRLISISQLHVLPHFHL